MAVLVVKLQGTAVRRRWGFRAAVVAFWQSV